MNLAMSVTVDVLGNSDHLLALLLLSLFFWESFHLQLVEGTVVFLVPSRCGCFSFLIYHPSCPPLWGKMLKSSPKQENMKSYT